VSGQEKRLVNPIEILPEDLVDVAVPTPHMEGACS